MNVEYQYVDPINPPDGYLEMLHKWHGKEKWNRFKKAQFEWYQQHPKYKIYAVKVDGVFVGQATAFGVNFCNQNEINELWWGVDTFLFKDYRGDGKGKQLQKKMHDDLPNFTSAAYSPINGIIKNKCGANTLFVKKEYYYPVTIFFSLLFSIFVKKIFHKNIKYWITIPNLYTKFYRLKTHSYEIREAVIDEALVSFINDTLRSQYDFFVLRNVEYMKWKYERNPAFKYKFFEFRKDGLVHAVVGFTDVRRYSIGGKTTNSVKILDSIIIKESKLTHNNLLVFVIDYWKQQGYYLDGVFSLIPCSFFPRVCIQKPVLSTIDAIIRKPYITYLDQDMEQEM